MFVGGPTTPHKDGGGEYSGFSGAEKSHTGFAAAADASISVTTSGLFRRFDSFPLFSFSETLDVMDVIKLTLRFKFKSVFFVVGISLPCHIDIFTASTKLSNGKLLSDSLVPQEADVMSFLQGDQAQPLTWGGDGLGVLPRWRCFFSIFDTQPGWQISRLPAYSYFGSQNPFKRICPIGQQHDNLTSKALKKGKFRNVHKMSLSFEVHFRWNSASEFWFQNRTLTRWFNIETHMFSAQKVFQKNYPWCLCTGDYNQFEI